MQYNSCFSFIFEIHCSVLKQHPDTKADFLAEIAPECQGCRVDGMTEELSLLKHTAAQEDDPQRHSAPDEDRTCKKITSGAGKPKTEGG